jgi:pimeloyl-ACP methyl ester carboxylesterase
MSMRQLRVVLRFALCFLFVAPSVGYAQNGSSASRITVTVDGHPLALWSRAPRQPKGAIVLLHGRTWSALPDFDLIVPGENRSVMQALVQRGYAVYALDARGYGATPRDSTGWLTPSRAANDVAAVLRFVAQRHPRLAAPTLVGWSYGSMVSHLTLQRDPSLASAVVLFGYPRDPETRMLQLPDTGAPPRQANTAKNAASDFIAPGMISPRAIEAYVAASLRADPIRADWRSLHEWNELSAPKLITPTLLLHGMLDPFTPIPSQSKTFTQLGSADRQWIILAKGDHAALLEDTLPAFIAAIVNFIERPRLPNP